MALGPIIVILLRLVLPPILIYKSPLWGTFASSMLDASDVIITSALGLGDFSNGSYHLIDKVLDFYFLTFAFFTVFSWKNILARRAAIVMYFWRLAGVLVFEITKVRWVLLIFNNMFQAFFIVWLGYIYFKKKEIFGLKDYKKLFIVVVFLFVFYKLPQEFVLHYLQAQPWVWFQKNILRSIN